ncbi:Uncharacterized membrane protein, DUF4010 family [Chitinophaga costaii]|uniref:Uncharacterized membrane protein, DUF4010 family n=1 Tax=Chitinophaga costaii TaxID=1335309 RepID=A0A1C4DI14_9BACT|nr:DUF4010 domain-containing protein [Chitinophaga costaii]PUZ24645.1 DUF4010 domain-containing protein [Chitinophaga costaii]SCC31019.1 Uncharacterized membrane protein, DUF4010 family [Chitinophaga costaii]
MDATGIAYNEFLHYPAAPVALKMAVAVGIGMLVGMERKWSHKEAGIRTFAIVALLGMLSAIIGENYIIASMVGVFLLVIAMNARSLIVEKTLEITTSAALLVNYLLGVLVGLGHIFTPVAGAIAITMLLAWKTELNRFAGGLLPSEIRSAIILGLIGFVIYPILPDRYIDPWQLFNPSDAWISVIAIAGIGFVNYVCLRVFSTTGFYMGAIFGGLVNSSATVAETSTRVQASGQTARMSTLCLLTTIAMFVRNLIIATLFAPASLTATLAPLLAMSLVSALFILRDQVTQNKNVEYTQEGNELKLTSPISVGKVLWFGMLFIVIQAGGTLLTQVFGSYGILATGIFGGLVSSASTTAAAATMAMHGKITASMAGSVAILSSLASAAINLPIVWRSIKDKAVVRKITWQLMVIMAIGIVMVLADRIFLFSDMLLRQ